VFRRYWLPVECSANRGSRLTTNPLRVPVLGEHLALCRDGAGKPGLLGGHRGHRGASLACGRVEDNGLRWLSHGWRSGREGLCLEPPAEPPASSFNMPVKHPSSPRIEVGGLIFTSLGPPDLRPNFPRYHDAGTRAGPAARQAQRPWPGVAAA
jgi:phenylpropionate dioxygenase-like ring-hydroxylating dioxygenase large terminal subunit